MEVDEDEETPKSKLYRLKDYQETGFRWLVNCWYNRRSSILAGNLIVFNQTYVSV
jgi:hypothetical protein